jgi:hypothetical protein
LLGPEFAPTIFCVVREIVVRGNSVDAQRCTLRDGDASGAARDAGLVPGADAAIEQHDRDQEQGG